MLGSGMKTHLGVVSKAAVLKVCSDEDSGGDLEPSCFSSMKWVSNTCF